MEGLLCSDSALFPWGKGPILVMQPFGLESPVLQCQHLPVGSQDPVNAGLSNCSCGLDPKVPESLFYCVRE